MFTKEAQFDAQRPFMVEHLDTLAHLNNRLFSIMESLEIINDLIAPSAPTPEPTTQKPASPSINGLCSALCNRTDETHSHIAAIEEQVVRLRKFI